MLLSNPRQWNFCSHHRLRLSALHQLMTVDYSPLDNHTGVEPASMRLIVCTVCVLSLPGLLNTRKRKSACNCSSLFNKSGPVIMFICKLKSGVQILLTLFLTVCKRYEVKGTVHQDFRPLVFFIIRTSLGH